MRHSLISFATTGFLVISASVPASAGPDEDIRFLSETLYSEAVIDTTFETLGPVLTDSVTMQMQRQGVSVSDPNRYLQIFIEEFRLSFLDRMRQDFQPVLRNQFTDEELAGLADFFRSPVGKRFSSEQANLMRAGSRIGQQAGMQAGIEATERVAKRVDDEGIAFIGRDGAKIDTLKFLRGY